MSAATTAGDAPRRRTLGRQERGKATRRNLIRTAARLWSERGFDEVTVEEICSAAGVGRTTFYLHFESKEHLLSGLAAGTAAGVSSELDAVGSDGPLDEQLEVFVTGVARRMEDVPKALAELVIHGQHIELVKTRAKDLGNPMRFADLLGDVLVDACARGELADDVDPVELGEILGALTMDAIEAWATDRTARPLDAALRFRFALVLDQFRTTSRA